MRGKEISPFWFMEDPIDLEHKYYILMSHLSKLEKNFETSEFPERFKNIIILKKDLESFIKSKELTQRTQSRMTMTEKDYYYDLLEKNVSKINEIEEIVNNSISVIDKFIENNKEHYEKYSNLVNVNIVCSKYNLWDQGFLIIRKKRLKNLKVFSWFFSIVKIGDQESLALLMSEIIDPKCENTEDLSEIKKFLRNNIKDFSYNDCLLIAEVDKSINIEIGTEICKEKSIDIIMDNFKK